MGEKLNDKSVAFKCLYSLLKIHNFRNIVHFLKRILQVVDNAVFWQKVLLYFENDPLSPSFRRFLLWSRDIPNMGVVRNI